MLNRERVASWGMAAGLCLVALGPHAGLTEAPQLALAAMLAISALAEVRRKQETPASGGPERTSRTELVLVAGLIVLAGAARLVALDRFPDAPNVDEGINGEAVLDILDGRGPGVMLEGYVTGEEAATFYLQAAFLSVLGVDLASFRLPSALAGTFGVFVFYLLCRRFTGVAAATMATLLLASDPTHLTFSRMANSIVYASTFQVMAFLFLQRAIGRGEMRDFTWLGLTLALGLHTYPAFRAVAVIIAVFLLNALAKGKEGSPIRRDGIYRALGLGALGMLPIVVSVGSLGAYAGRMAEVTIVGMNPLELPAHLAEALPRLFWVLLGLEPARPNYTLFTPLTLVLAILGAGAMCGGKRPLATVALLLVATGLVAPLVTTMEPVSGRRFILTLAPMYLLAAVGVQAVIELMRRANELLPVSVSGSLLMASLGLASMSGLACYLEQDQAVHRNARLLCSVIRFGKQHPTITRRATVRYLSGSGRVPISHDISFLLRAFDVPIAKALNPYPLIPPQKELNFLLSDGLWMPHLREAFPGGVQTRWLDRVSNDVHLSLFTVRGAEAWQYQGLMWTSTSESGTVRKHVRDLPDAVGRLAKGSVQEWSGALYVPEAGMLELVLQGQGDLMVSLGSRSASGRQGQCRVRGWAAEGWHPLRVVQLAAEGPVGPLELEWKLPGSPEPARVPATHFLNHVPASEQHRARPTSKELVTLVEESRNLGPCGEPGELLQDFAQDGPMRYVLRSGAKPLQLVHNDGRPVETWPGLRDYQQRPIELPLESGVPFISFSMALARNGAGGMLIVETQASRLYWVTGDGRCIEQLNLDPERYQVMNATYDWLSNSYLVCDPRGGRILRYGVAAEKLAPWPVAGVTAVCRATNPDTLYALSPSRGGIVLLDNEGKEKGFWRAPEQSAMSRIACDDRGRVFILTDGRHLVGYSPAGELVLPTTPLPPRARGDDAGLFAVAMRHEGDGRFRFLIDEEESGWLVLKVEPAGAEELAR